MRILLCPDCGATKSRSGIYCKPCGYKHRRRPSGLKYVLLKENPTAFKSGHSTWNRGLVIKEKITYKELHRWVARHRGKADLCERCGSDYMVQWANKSHEYKRDLQDWLKLCKVCHGKHDSGDNRGSAIRIFGRKDVACR